MEVKPILFNGEMVRAIEDDRKTQTRRPIKLPGGSDMWEVQSVDRDPLLINEGGRIWTEMGWIATFEHLEEGESYENVKSPYGGPRDIVWVRETWAVGVRYCGVKPSEILDRTGGDEYPEVYYRADMPSAADSFLWRPSIHMPRWASRSELYILRMDVELLCDIGEADARAEGFADIGEFKEQWNKIYESRGAGWGTNPYVWVMEFCRFWEGEE